jgi:hypothetical protein
MTQPCTLHRSHNTLKSVTIWTSELHQVCEGVGTDDHKHQFHRLSNIIEADSAVVRICVFLPLMDNGMMAYHTQRLYWAEKAFR